MSTFMTYCVALVMFMANSIWHWTNAVANLRKKPKPLRDWLIGTRSRPTQWLAERVINLGCGWFVCGVGRRGNSDSSSTWWRPLTSSVPACRPRTRPTECCDVTHNDVTQTCAHRRPAWSDRAQIWVSSHTDWLRNPSSDKVRVLSPWLFRGNFIVPKCRENATGIEPPLYNYSPSNRGNKQCCDPSICLSICRSIPCP